MRAAPPSDPILRAIVWVKSIAFGQISIWSSLDISSVSAHLQRFNKYSVAGVGRGDKTNRNLPMNQKTVTIQQFNSFQSRVTRYEIKADEILRIYVEFSGTSTIFSHHPWEALCRESTNVKGNNEFPHDIINNFPLFSFFYFFLMRNFSFIKRTLPIVLGSIKQNSRGKQKHKEKLRKEKRKIQSYTLSLSASVAKMLTDLIVFWRLTREPKKKEKFVKALKQGNYIKSSKYAT